MSTVNKKNFREARRLTSRSGEKGPRQKDKRTESVGTTTDPEKMAKIEKSDREKDMLRL